MTLPELTTLDCRDNQIEYLPYYPKLTKINLTGNPIAELMADPTRRSLTCSGLRYHRRELENRKSRP